MEYLIAVIVVVGVWYFISGEKKVAATKTKKQVSKKKAPSVAELKKLTKVQLLEHADKNKIKVKKSGTKAEVIKTIAQHK